VVVLVALWGVGAAALLRQAASREEARLAEAVGAAGAAVEEEAQALVREAGVLARDAGVVDGSMRGDWAALARGVSPRMLALTMEGLADLLVLVDAGGATLLQVPALPPVAIPDLVPPAAPTAAVRVLDGRAWLLGLASVRWQGDTTVGVVAVGRRLERLGRRLATAPGRPVVVAVAGDRLLGTTHGAAPQAGWLAAARAGVVDIAGRPWALRPLGRDGVLWAAVPAAREPRAPLWLGLGAALAAGIAAVAAAAWITRRDRGGDGAAAGPRQLDTLYEATRAAASGADVPTTAAELLRAACALTRLEAGAVLRLTGDLLTPVAQRGMSAAEMTRLGARPVGASHAGEALRRGRPVVTDLRRSPLLEPDVRALARATGRRLQIAVPVTSAGAPWGVIVLLSRGRRAPSAEILRMLTAVAEQFGAAAARSALATVARDSSRRLEALTDLSRTLTSAAALETVLQRVVDAAAAIFGAHEARVWLLDQDGATVALAAHAGAGAAGGLQRFAAGEGLVGVVIGSPAPTIVADLAADPRVRNADRVRAEGLVSFAGAPLLVEDRVLGALTIATRAPHRFTEDEVALVQCLAAHAAAAIENTRRFTEQARDRDQLAALLEINKRIAGAESTEALLQGIAEEAARLLDVDNAGFRLVDGDELVIAGLAGTAAETMLRPRIRIGQSFSGLVVREGRTMVAAVGDVADLIPEHRLADERLGYGHILGVPLRAGDRIIGVLVFSARRPFTARQCTLAEAFAGQAALALEHARLFREASRHAERMAALADVERLLAETLEPDVVAQRIADSLRVLVQAHAAGVYRLDPAREDLVALSVAGSTRWNLRLPAGHGAVGLAVRERRPIVSTNILTDPRITLSDEARATVEAGVHRSAVALPLTIRDRVIGGLVVADREERLFDAEDVRLIQAFANQAAVALENARLFGEAARHAERMAGLADVERLLSEALDPDVVAQRIVDSVGALLGARSAALYGVEAESGALVAVTISRDVGSSFHWTRRLPAGHGVVGLAMAERRPAVTADVLSDPRLAYEDAARAAIEAATHRALIAVPLLAGERVLGALAVGDRTGREFTDEDVRLARAFADQAALALENARLFSLERARRSQLEALAAVERVLAAELDRDRLLHLIVESASRLFSGHGTIYLLGDGGTMVRAAWLGEPVGDGTLALGAGVSGACAAERRGKLLNDYAASPLALPAFIAVGTTRVMAQPLVAADRLLGVLSMSRRGAEAAPFSADDLSVLESFANQAAIVLENARLHAEARRGRHEAEELARVARTLTESLEVSAVGARIVDSVVALLSAHSAGLRLLAPDGSLVVVAWHGADGAHLEPGHVQPPGTGLAGRAIVEGRPVWSADILNDAGLTLDGDLREWIAERGHHSALAVPLTAKGRTIGVLLVAHADRHAFTEREVSLARAFADQAALALDNARLHEEAERRRREVEARAARLRTLSDVNRLVSSSLDTAEVLNAIARAASELMDAFVAIWVADEAARTLTFSAVSDAVAAVESPITRLAFGEGAVGQAAAERRTIDVPDATTSDRFRATGWARAAGIVGFRAVPIVLQGALLGVLALGVRRPLDFDADDEALLDSFVAQAAVALEHARLYAETRRRLEETRALLEVAEILNSTLDPRQLLKRATIKIAQVCGVDRSTLELWDGDRVVPLMSQFADGRREPAMWEAFVSMPPYAPREVPAQARALETRRPVIIEDATTTDQLPREWIDVFGHKSYMVVPLIRQDHVIGVLTLDYTERVTPFQDWQVSRATAIAGQLALALENTRLYAQAQERLRETTTLLAVSHALSRPAPVEEGMRRMAREVARVTGADAAAVCMLDDAGVALRPVAGYHVPPALRELLEQAPIVLARLPFVRDAAATGGVVWSADPAADPRFDAAWAARLPAHSVLFAAARVRGETNGGLFLVWTRPGRAVEPAEARLVEGVAAQIGLALDNAALARQREERLRETETLLAVSRALSSTLDLDPLLRQFMRQIAGAVGADTVGVWMLDASGEWMAPVAGYRVPRVAEARALRLSIVEHAFYAEAVRQGRPVFASDAAGDPRIPRSLLEAFPHRSQLFAPVRGHDRVIGGFVAVWWERPRTFTDRDLALMEAIAGQAGVAIEQARLFEENRRQVEELSVLHELSRAVTGQLDHAALLDTVRANVLRVLGADKIVVLLLDERTGEFEVVLRVMGGADVSVPARYPRSVGLASVVVDTGRTFRTDDYGAECARRGLALPPGGGPRYWVGAPLRAGAGTLGVLTASREARPFTDGDERLLGNIADLAALALRSARLYEERTRAYSELTAAQDHLVRTEKLRALGEMASGVAHDFNNLLAAILGRTQLVLRHVEDPKLRRWLEVIERSALDGAQTVRRLQDFARVRRDQPKVSVDLRDVVRDALDITQSRWREEAMGRGLAIDVRTSLERVLPIAGDPAELREAMTNLILNAVDAMPEGGALTLATRMAGRRVEVTVADTGVGIPADVRDKIFDPFFTTKGPRGTGLGLSMTYGIVARHGGSITVDSEPGRGATFRLSFPPSHAVDPTPVVAGPATGAPAVALRCLVVDDEETVGAVLGDTLEALGHQAVVVTDGTAAVDLVRAERFDVVFTDLAMPGVSGWQVAVAVKASAPDVPVFLVTGFGVEVPVIEQRAHGVDGILPKPLRIEDVKTALAQVAAARGR